jgi:type 1 fimbriae regulatory protein FimB/type 1 fimbriae regulatory protein FimE
MDRSIAARPAPMVVTVSVGRSYLTEREVERLIEAARRNRHGHRDACMVLVAYRHGLRASELCDLLWSQVELNASRLHVRRLKHGVPSVHPMQGDEIRALRRLQREQEQQQSYVFLSERDAPMTAKGFHSTIRRLGEDADLGFRVHPHMLRHACGYALASAGHDTRRIQAWLGHRNIQHTVRYTALAPDAFREFWR